VNGSPDDPCAEEHNKLRLAPATFALHLDAFEARLKRSGQRQTPKSLLGAIEPDPSTGATTALGVPQANAKTISTNSKWCWDNGLRDAANERR
jgi:hypothetical protein